MSKELKPCPFCGCEEQEVKNDVGVGNKMFLVLCNCGAETDYHQSEQGAVNHWNTRTESAELEQLRKERDDCVMALKSMVEQFGEPDGSDFINEADYAAVSLAKKVLFMINHGLGDDDMAGGDISDVQ